MGVHAEGLLALGGLTAPPEDHDQPYWTNLGLRTFTNNYDRFTGR